MGVKTGREVYKTVSVSVTFQGWGELKNQYVHVDVFPLRDAREQLSRQRERRSCATLSGTREKAMPTAVCAACQEQHHTANQLQP